MAVDFGGIVLDAIHPPPQLKPMKIILMFLGLVASLLLVRPVEASRTDTNPPASQLTIELRDGSRVVGTSGHDHLKFHSALLGDLLLEVKALQSVDCVASNSAKLLMTNGDTLMVWFADSTVTAKTSFGKVELAVDSIRKITVSGGGAIGARRPGLVAQWSGENNGKDSIGGNDAELTDMGFADGQVGQAFFLNGSSSWAKIPANPSLDVGKGDGLTISAWIKPSNIVSFHPIMEWEVTRQKNAVSLWIGHLPQDRGVLAANIGDTAGNNHQLISPPRTIVSGQFQQVSLTYDKVSGVAKLFVNGQIVAQENIGLVNPDTTGPIFISRRPCDQPGDWTYNTFFDGLLNEVAIYNRALSTAEIRAICLEENHGEPLPPPAASAMMPFRQNHIGIMNDSN